jgi:hypothetical protein
VSRFDRVLVGPPPAEVKEALAEAWRAATSRGPSAKTRGRWAELLGRLDADPEGQQVWRVRAQSNVEVAAAWWCDFLGRRHVRVRGWDGMPAWLYEAPSAALPAVYPDHTLTHQGEGGSRQFVLCSCGAWGEPAAVGWMGECCGPCHDRRSAGEPPRHAWPLAEPGSARSVAVEPGGWSVAALHDDGTVSVHDLRTGRRTASLPVGTKKAMLRLAPGGRLLATRPSDSSQNVVAVWDTATGDRLARLPLRMAALAVAADGSLYTRDGGVQVCRPPYEGWRGLAPGQASAFALSPQGDRVAVVSARGPARIVDAATGEEVLSRELPAAPCSHLAFAADGRLFVALEEAPRQRPWALYEAVAGRTVTQVRWPGTGWVSDVTLAVSPDGGAVAAGAGADVRVWPLPDGDGAAPFAGAFGASHTSERAWLPDGRLLRFDWRRGAVTLWPAELFRRAGRAGT